MCKHENKLGTIEIVNDHEMFWGVCSDCGSHIYEPYKHKPSHFPNENPIKGKLLEKLRDEFTLQAEWLEHLKEDNDKNE